MFGLLRSFQYHQPRSIQEATELLAELGSEARILAGGCDLLPELRRRQAAPSSVVSIMHIPDLDFVTFHEDRLTIGARASLRTVERFPAVLKYFPALLEGIGSIASVQVKSTGTLVGNLCVATPASDIMPPLMVMQAQARIDHPNGHRVVPIRDLLRGAKISALSPGEVVTEIYVEKPRESCGGAFAKLTRTAADIAKLNVAASIQIEDRTCQEVRIVLGSVAATSVRAFGAEALLSGALLEPGLFARAGVQAAEEITPITDIRSTAAYRRDATEVLVARVLEIAAARAVREAS